MNALKSGAVTFYIQPFKHTAIYIRLKFKNDHKEYWFGLKPTEHRFEEVSKYEYQFKINPEDYYGWHKYTFQINQLFDLPFKKKGFELEGITGFSIRGEMNISLFNSIYLNLVN